MFYADTVGLTTVLARVNAYRRQLGDYWRPSPLLEKLATEGRGFHGDAA
jgi:3-hydroxyacyl-CoA dehydrogenase